MMKLGILLPHFGEHSSAKRVIEIALKAETLGYDSVWVRDHLVFKPHRFEGKSSFFLSPFETLAAIAGVTERIGLGTCVAIPVRHALAIAQSYITISQYAPNRVTAGLGAGNFRHEFTAVDIPFNKRTKILEDILELLPLAFSGKSFSYKGRVLDISEVQFDPGAAGQIPVLVGGYAAAVIRRAALCDGWLPGRIPFTTFSKRYSEICNAREEAGLGSPLVGALPLVSIDDNRKTAEKFINTELLLKSANNQKWFVKPESGSFQSIKDLKGMILAGTAEEIQADIKNYEKLGADFLVLDFRSREKEINEQMERFAEEVLPTFKGGC